MIGAMWACPASGAVLLSDAAIAAGKPAIVLVDEARETASVWASLQARLQRDGYETVAVNLVARPGSPLPAGEASAGLCRDAVVAKLESLKTPGGPGWSLISRRSRGQTSPQQRPTGSEPWFMSWPGCRRPATPCFPSRKATLTARRDSPAALWARGRIARLNLPDGVIGSSTTAPLASTPGRCGHRCRAARAAGNPRGADGGAFRQGRRGHAHTVRDIVVSPEVQAAMVAMTAMRVEIALESGHVSSSGELVGLAGATEAAAT